MKESRSDLFVRRIYLDIGGTGYRPCHGSRRQESTVANRAPVLSYVKRLNAIAVIIIYPFCAGAACVLIAFDVYAYAFSFCAF
jgi:hypothetical protein